MAAPKLKYATGNSSSTTLASGMTDSDTSAALTSDTNFSAKSGEGMVIFDEGTATEELAYSTTKSGGALTVPLANRGLEGGSAQAHSAGTTVKGILSALMWNDLIDSLKNVLDQTTGAVKSNVELDKPIVTGEYDNGNSGTSKAIDWSNGDRQKVTMTGNCVFTYTNAVAGQTLTLRLVQDGTGSRTVTLPTTLWPGGSAGTFSTGAADIDLMITYYDGTNYLSQLAADFS